MLQEILLRRGSQAAGPRTSLFWSTPCSAQVDSDKQLTKTKYGILKLKLRVALNLFRVLGSKRGYYQIYEPLC